MTYSIPYNSERDHLHVYCAGYCLRCGKPDPWCDDEDDDKHDELHGPPVPTMDRSVNH